MVTRATQRQAARNGAQSDLGTRLVEIGLKGKEQMMPPPPRRIPLANERTVLQKMSLTRGLPPEQPHHASDRLLATLAAKGWIERQPDGRTYCITQAGDQALRTIIPVMRPK